jgi:small subunit ribosomal protein S9
MATATKEPTKKAPAHAAAEHKPAAHAAEHKEAAAPARKARYIEAIGRRKTAIARVRVSVGDGKFTVNEKAPKDYFDLPRLITAALAPLTDLQISKDFDVSAHVSGGGIHAQAEAIRLGIARAIVEKDPAQKLRLRASGFLTRDSRMVERKKPGLRKARRRPQWAKR